MKITIDLNEMTPAVASILRFAHRARKLAEVWVDLPSRWLMADELFADLEVMRTNTSDWPPREQQLTAWQFPETPDVRTKDSLFALARGLENPAHAQILHAELIGELCPTTIELGPPAPPSEESESPTAPVRFRRVERSRKWLGVL